MIGSNPRKEEKVRSMLIIHQGALGDFILTLPTLSALREAFPQAKTVMMGYPRILQLAAGRFYADEIVSVDQKGMATFFVREGILDRDLSQYFSGFDLLVVFGKDREGPLMKNLGRVCQGLILHINPLPRWDEGIHLTEYLLRQLANYRISPRDGIPRLHLRPEDREWAKHFWLSHGVSPKERPKVIILHPGSGSRKKVWPVDRFLELLQRLQRRHQGKCLLILGPAEGPETQKIFESLKSPHLVVARGLSLLELASVMEGGYLFIGNDSGISHMAAALGIPVVAIFGPTDPRVWAPRGEKVEVVRKQLPCAPCGEERFFLCKDLECLDQVTVGDVLEKIREMGMEV